MLYLIHGEDTIRSKARLKELKTMWLKKHHQNTLFVFDEDNFSLDEIKNLAKNVSIFYEKYLVVLNRIFENKNFANFIIKEFRGLKSSDNVFLFWEEKIGDDVKKLFAKDKTKIEYFKLAKKTDSKNEINLFPLIDAVFERKNKLALKIFYRVLNHGASPDDVFWKLWWGLKSLLLVAKYKNEKEQYIRQTTGLHPYVIKKYLLYSRGFTETKIEDLLKNLLAAYNYSKLGLRELNNEVELFILKI